MPTRSANDFIELNRTFHELSEHAGKSDDIDLSQVFAVKTNLTWDDALKFPRSVILSEAGSGKTQEIRHAAEKLRGEGKAAFFLRLELVPDDFDIAFEVGSLNHFQSWLASSEQGWLLLDSVDEARLRSPFDFERAIRRIGKLIEHAKGRSTIILTGRTHAWRPKTDFELCERHIGYPPKDKKITIEEDEPSSDVEDDFEIEIETREQSALSDSRFRMLALDDLSREQVGEFASAKKVGDLNNFIKEIERVDAWSSTTRPQDLEDVIALWQDTGKIGSRLQIMRASVERRLTERDQPRAEAVPLSKDRACEGATLLAAAATLEQTQVILVPDGATNRIGLSPKSILSDWGDQELAALLSRPIFDDAIYGAVRFHHRSAREYLTAVWLHQLLERPASRRAVEDLLFKNIYGLDVVVPTMRPVLPWLAIFDDRTLQRLRAIAPEVIFEGGDPSSLPLPTRKEILREVCAKIAQDRIPHSATEYAAVQRFAQPDIAEDIRLLMRQFASNDAVTGFLTRMIWLGRLHGLQAEAKKVALDKSASRYTRISAFRALREIASIDDQAEVRNAFLQESPRLAREWIGELMSELEPTHENIRWVLQAVEKSDDKERYSVDRLEDALTAFAETANSKNLPELRAGLARLLDESPYIERGYCEVSKRHAWIMKAATHLVQGIIASRDPLAMQADSLEILRKFRAVREWGEEVRNIKVGFEKLVPEWTELNDASFWHDILATRQVVARKDGARLTDYWQAQVFGAFWKFGSSDFSRVCDWIRTRPEQDDRLVALTLGFAICKENGKPKDLRDQLKHLCEEDAELKARLHTLLHPGPEVAKYKVQKRRWKRQSTARAKRQAEQLEKNKLYAQTHTHLIRDSGFPDPAGLSQLQWYLHHQAQENKSSSKWTDGSWRELIPTFGKEVAEAFRDGAMAYWRKFDPQLRSGGAEPNKTSAKIIFGLAGLAMEARERPETLAILATDDVERATKYALHELNGFPSWFPDLYQKNREAVAKIILGEIEYELQTGVPDTDSNYVLSDIAWSGEWAWNDFAPALYALLEKNDPNNLSQLHRLLKVIQRSNLSDLNIAKLASKKVTSAPVEHRSDWFAVWVGVDPDKAMPDLAEHLNGLGTATERRKEFAMRFITKLWGGRRAETFGARDRFKTPVHLKKLYFMMHEHIRVQDDIERSNGVVYSPELRDDAQDARNRILQVLSEMGGKEAYLALDEIANAYRQRPSFAHLESLARSRAERDADLGVWAPESVREFNERLDRTPSNHRELADLAVLRLLDLKDDLEESDDSIAAVVRPIDQETILRNFIGRDLRQKAFGRYAIPQEEQLADDKKPDLRFHGMGFDAPVPAELKIADNWSGPDLFERLENQLAGDYLRDVRGGRGIFVLVYRGLERKGWNIPGSRKSINFGELIAALRTYWNTIAPKYPNVDDITIIGIDLTKRFK